MASYPSAIWSPSDITDGTTLEASLFNDAEDEIDAIELELGLMPQGDAGSLAERIDMVLDRDGSKQIFKIADANLSGERKRIRAGVTPFDDSEFHTVNNRSGQGTIQFSPGTINNVDAFLTLQTVSDDLEVLTDPHTINFVHASGTPTSFDFRVSTAQNVPPSGNQQWLVHWIAIERSFTSSGEYDDQGGFFAGNDGENAPGDFYLKDDAGLTILDGGGTLDSKDFDPTTILLENGSGWLQIEDGVPVSVAAGSQYLKEDGFLLTLEDGSGEYLLET